MSKHYDILLTGITFREMPLQAECKRSEPYKLRAVLFYDVMAQVTAEVTEHIRRGTPALQ